jgi:hypothetical protein
MKKAVVQSKAWVLCGAFVAAGTPLSAPATQAIANWDVVPFQTLALPFKAGVVAFHETGVDVVFQINGKEVARVSDPKWNDRTRVHEHWMEIYPAAYADGPITLGATAIPDEPGHEPRELPNITLYANSRGTLTNPRVVWADASGGSDETGDGTEAKPFATIRQAVLAAGDGGTVYLKAGQEYRLTAIGGPPFQYWTTIAAAPGLSSDDVHILTFGRDNTSTGRYGKSHLRWKNVTLFCDRRPGYGNIFYFDDGQEAWFDGVVLTDKNGRFGDTTVFNRGRPYVTDSIIRDVANVFGTFHRNVRMERILSDVFRGASNLTAINVEVRMINRGDTKAHPDFIQFYNPNQLVENVILYNNRCYDMEAQGIFGGEGEIEDVAFVNLLLEKQPASSPVVSQVSGDWRHILLWHTTLVNQPFNFREASRMRQWDVRNCVFDAFSAGAKNLLPAESRAQAVHVSRLTWQQKEPLGEGATVGDPLFVAPLAKDYRLQPTSPCVGTGVRAPDVPADIDGHPFHSDHPDRGAFSASNPGRR